jgi:hypothetical protein
MGTLSNNNNKRLIDKLIDKLINKIQLVKKDSSCFTFSGGNCDVSNSVLRKCQKCRYNKCLSNGMDPKWVLSEDQKRSRYGLVEHIPKFELVFQFEFLT